MVRITVNRQNATADGARRSLPRKLYHKKDASGKCAKYSVNEMSENQAETAATDLGYLDKPKAHGNINENEHPIIISETPPLRDRISISKKNSDAHKPNEARCAIPYIHRPCIAATNTPNNQTTNPERMPGRSANIVTAKITIKNLLIKRY